MSAEKPVNELVDHLFRHSAGQMIAFLTRVFGIEKIDLVEDAIQESMISALRVWPFKGIPDNPRAWLLRVARNRVIDRLRRAGKFEVIGDEIDEAAAVLENVADEIRFTAEVGEDVLRMMFACCHPSIPPDARVALTLKTVGGFSVGEIATAFLSNEEAVTRQLTRAKTKLREGNVRLEMPSPLEIPERLDAVLKVLYLLFNEGYNASEGDRATRDDLCLEAIRLTRILASHPTTAAARVDAMLALFLFQTARLETRFDDEGNFQPLAKQDRARWNRAFVGEGLHFFGRSARGDEVSVYHLEAEAASVHALAESYEKTDWQRILRCYDDIIRRTNSPVIRLNRAIVLAEIQGDAAGLAELRELAKNPVIANYQMFQISLGEFESRAGDRESARRAFETALESARTKPARRFVEEKLERLN
jgi:RNA polymerase sigma-70 factor (ECF subfamily)